MILLRGYLHKMAGGMKHPKKSNWKGVPKKRCKTEGCKKRVRSYQELGLCNKCVNDHNRKIEEENKSNKQKKREKFQQ